MIHIESLKNKVKSIKENFYKAIDEFGEVLNGEMTYSEFYTFENKQITEKTMYSSEGKIVEKEMFRFDNNGNILEKNSYDNEGLRSKYIYNYNEIGQPTENLKYNSQKKKENRTVFKYDKSGNQVESWNLIGPKDSFISKTLKKFDDNGNQIEKRKCDLKNFSRNIFTYTYNELGLLIEECNNHFQGSVEAKTLYHYDSNGNKISEERFDYKGVRTLKVDTSYNNIGLKIKAKVLLEDKTLLVDKWDKLGNHIEHSCYRPDGTLNSQDISLYDDFGNIKTRKIFSKGHDPEHKTLTFEYVYDSSNNWVKMIEFENRFPQKVTEREISYYE